MELVTCEICKREYKSKFDYQRHIKSKKHKQLECDMNDICFICNKQFPTKSKLTRHKNRKTSCKNDNNDLNVGNKSIVVINNNIVNNITNIINIQRLTNYQINKLETYKINPTDFKNPKYLYLTQLKNHTESYMLSDDTINNHNNYILEYFKHTQFNYKPINIFTKADEQSDYEYHKNNNIKLFELKELYQQYKKENLNILNELYTIHLIKILKNEFVNTQKTINNYFFIHHYKLCYKSSPTTFTKLCKDALDVLISYNKEELFDIIKSLISKYLDCIDLDNFDVLVYNYDMLYKELYNIVEHYIDVEFLNLQLSKPSEDLVNINELILTNNYKYHLKGERY